MATVDSSTPTAPPTGAQKLRRDLLRWDPPQLTDEMQAAWTAFSKRPVWQAFKLTVPHTELPLLTVVGSDSPNAKTYFEDDGSVLIAITDGMIRVVQDCCRALFASAAFVKNGGAVTERATLARSEADDVLLSTYLSWAQMSSGDLSKPLDLPLGPQAERLVEIHSRHALLFIGLHEYAHATHHRGIPESALIELEADRWALNMMFDADGRPIFEQGFTLAGALIAMRVFAALDIMGIFDIGYYPTPNARLLSLMTEYRQRCPDAISFYLSSQPQYVLDLRMSASEAKLVRTPSRKDQLIAQLVAQFHAVHLKRQTPDQARQTINEAFDQSWIKPRDVLLLAADVFDTAQTSYQSSKDDDPERFVIDSARAYLGMD